MLAPVIFCNPVAVAGPPSPPEVSESAPSQGVPPHSIPWRTWDLFDPYLSLRDVRLEGGPLVEQPVGSGPASRQGGFFVGFGQGIETARGPLWLRLERDWLFRWSGGGHGVFNLFQFGIVGGPAIGPLAVAGGVELGVAQIHFGEGGFGLGFLSPRAKAGVTLTLGSVRVAVQGYEEYAWRWTGGPSAFVRGVVLELGLTSTPGLPEKYRLEQ